MAAHQDSDSEHTNSEDNDIEDNDIEDSDSEDTCHEVLVLLVEQANQFVHFVSSSSCILPSWLWSGLIVPKVQFS